MCKRGSHGPKMAPRFHVGGARTLRVGDANHREAQPPDNEVPQQRGSARDYRCVARLRLALRIIAHVRSAPLTKKR